MTKLSKEEKEKIKQEKALKAEQDRIEGLIQRSLDNLTKNENLYQNPTRTFNVGEKVDVFSANWKNMEIVKVYKNLFYLFKYDHFDNNYGNPKKISGSLMWRPWTQLRSLESKKETNFGHKKGLDITYANRNLESLFSNYYFFGVDTEPSYQRELVWDLEDKVALIDSIFRGLDIGKFVFINLPFKDNSPSQEILDGKQRLNAIIEFTQDRFKYKGVYYSELSVRDIFFF
jgi:hypothetical protein